MSQLEESPRLSATPEQVAAETVETTKVKRSRKAPQKVKITPVMHGTKGQAQYDAVKALVSQGVKTQDAFARVAQEMDTKSGTVATAYYRIARKDSDSPVQARPRKRVTARATSTPKARSLSERLEAILAEVRELEQDAALGRAVRQTVR